ncbi:hypothetical protein NKR23_g8763 [Pleurostoma richardsiae]|uniref:Uncharacterized protein n=1 Tax=Pleurostoma richardsiae TaxID=41990 RepID=A0AA38VKV9_9PEZI|nr:hypothetical protein NKR23_g8763 [Pleurostoma richardsiae]
MALWLFRRRSRRKRARSGTQSDAEATPEPVSDTQRPRRAPTRRKTEPQDELDVSAAPTPEQQLKKQRTEPNKLHRRAARTYSFEAGQQDNIRVGRRKSSRIQGPSQQAAHAAHATSYSSPQLNGVTAAINASGSLGDDAFGRVPTLHSKRDGEHLMPRKKSSKRRKADHDREAEIKAMANFMPVRPATDAWQAGRPMKKDTRRVKTGLGVGGFGLGSKWDKDNPSSDISLPIPESIRSTLSSDSEQISYKVSAFDALAPRPTLRYAVYPRWSPPSAGSGPERIPSQRRKLSEKAPVPDATLRAHKRIDDLADELSASDLRELMERDQRRRERKQLKEQEKVERRLARRAEKQRAAEQEGRESPPNLERGVLGREMIGLGIDPASAVVTSSSRRPSSGSSQKKSSAVDEADELAGDEATQAGPLGHFYRTTSIPLATPALAAEPQEATPASPEQSPKIKTFLRPKKSRSSSPPLLERERTDVSDSLRKGSETSSAKGGVSWASFFRWGNKNKRNSGPSSFSNTSRDSMALNQPPPPAAAYSAARKMSSGVPKRTMSRFREDLPELPMSPPESRIQSPEADSLPPPILEQDSPELNQAYEPASSTPIQRYDTPASGRMSAENQVARETPTSWNRPDDADPSPEPQAMSLASIDSEGSWLSGRLAGRRRSNLPRSQPPSRQRLYHHQHSSSNGSEDTHHDPDLHMQEHDSHDDGANIVEDEYLSRFANHRSSGSQWTYGKSTGEARPSSDEDEDAHWGSVGGRQPTVVQPHMAERMKSREGFLNTFGEEDESEAEDLMDDEKDVVNFEEDKETGLQRATSINLGRGHARHISAGSAKLLELTPRTSVDAKRRSLEPRTAN